MKKLNSIKKKYRILLVAVAIILFVLIAFTQIGEIEFPSIAVFTPLVIIGIVVLSKKTKKEEAASNEK